VNHTTVQRVLKTGLDITHHIAAKKPFLNTNHTQKRFQWAKEHRALTMANWKCLIWTDEASVKVGKQLRQCTVWQKPGERYQQECLVPTFKSRQQSVMIWGCISYGMWGPLVQIPSDMCKGANYVNLVLGGPFWDVYVE
jgi:hypothetical protein